MEQQHPIVMQRNALAARNLDMEIEIVLRDQRIAELEALVKALSPPMAAPDEPSLD